MIPPMTTVASGPLHFGARAGRDRHRHEAQRCDQRAVIRTGRNRLIEPSRTASATGRPWARSPWMNEMITSPFSTATPDKAMKPTPALIESGMSRSTSAATPPVRASGTPLNTRSGVADGAEAHAQQDEDQQQRHRHNDGQPLRGRDQLLEPPAPADPVARRQLDLLSDAGLHLGHEGAEVAIAHVSNT